MGDSRDYKYRLRKRTLVSYNRAKRARRFYLFPIEQGKAYMISLNASR